MKSKRGVKKYKKTNTFIDDIRNGPQFDEHKKQCLNRNCLACHWNGEIKVISVNKNVGPEKEI